MSRTGEEPSKDVGELSVRTVEWMDALRSGADEVAGGLRVAWRLGPEGVRRSEATTLLSAIALYQNCQRTLGTSELPPAPEPDLLTAISPVAETETRYDIEAALRTIPELVPRVVRFTMYGVYAYLPDPDRIGFNAWSDQLNERHAEVADEWHDWIWASHRYGGAVVRHEELTDEAARDYGDSSMLALAAGRLSAGLTTILGE